MVNADLASLPQAWEMASTRPAKFMKLPGGGLEVGSPADLVLMRFDNRTISIEATYKAGERVFAR